MAKSTRKKSVARSAKKQPKSKRPGAIKHTTRYFVCHAGDDRDPNSPAGFMGRVYCFRGEWVRSPEEVKDSERNPVMKLYPAYATGGIIEADLGCFTEVYFDEGEEPDAPVF